MLGFIVQSVPSPVLNVCLVAPIRSHSPVPAPALHTAFPLPGIYFVLPLTLTFPLAQELANYDPGAQSSPLPLFQSTFFWNTASLIPLHIVYGCPHTSVAKFNGCSKA